MCARPGDMAPRSGCQRVYTPLCAVRAARSLVFTGAAAHRGPWAGSRRGDFNAHLNALESSTHLGCFFFFFLFLEPFKLKCHALVRLLLLFR